MITTGVTGGRWRASITPWGAIEPWDGSGRLDWYVAADDRWHVPGRSASVRQRRLDGTAVVETRLRVPRGDAVQHVYSVADGPGYTVVEITNESPLPIVVAFDRGGLCTERPVGSHPPVGIDLPSGSCSFPVGHQASVRVALAHDPSAGHLLPSDVPHAPQVTRGWTMLTERASRLVLPQPADAAAVTAARCEVALGAVPDLAADPAGFVLAAEELVRMGESVDPWIPGVAAAVEAVARRPDSDTPAVLDAAARLVHRAGERRALEDLARIGRRLAPVPVAPDEPTDDTAADIRVVSRVERRLARNGEILPAGIPSGWFGAGFEAHGLPIGVASTLSYAVRWHGERPAVLWEVSGDPVRLSAPAVDPTWQTGERTGEALWPAPTSVG